MSGVVERTLTQAAINLRLLPAIGWPTLVHKTVEATVAIESRPRTTSIVELHWGLLRP